MKTLFKLLFIPLFLVATSCDNFLKEDPKALITGEYFLTEDGLQKSVFSIYESLRDLTDPLYMLGEGGTDIFTQATNGQNYTNGAAYNDGLMTSSNFTIRLWRALYRSLNISNMVLENIERVEISDAKKKQYTAEVKSLRAFFLWLLAETWGPGAHFSVKSTKGVITDGYQPGLGAFYKQILEDINQGILGLDNPGSVQYGRMNVGVAKALKTKMLLSLAAYETSVLQEAGYSKDKCYDEAIELSKSVINDYSYKLLPSYASFFDTNNQINNEVIWSIQYTTDQQYNSGGRNHMHRYLIGWYNRSARNLAVINGLPSHSVYYGREYRWVMPTLSYIKMFNEYDKRLNETFQTVWYRVGGAADPNGKNPVIGDTLLVRSLKSVTDEEVAAFAKRGIVLDGLNHIYNLETGVPTSNGRSCQHSITKHLDRNRETPLQEYSFKDAVIMRLGEIYLLQAEAYIRKGLLTEAAQSITKLRERAVITGHEEAMKVSGSDMTIDFLLDEDARELGGEFFRWYTLKRSGKLVERVQRLNPDYGVRIKNHHVYRPLPQAELDVVSDKESLLQNQGY